MLEQATEICIDRVADSALTFEREEVRKFAFIRRRLRLVFAQKERVYLITEVVRGQTTIVVVYGICTTSCRTS